MTPSRTFCRTLIAATALLLTSCGDSTVALLADPLVVRVAEDTVAAQMTSEGGLVLLTTTLELHNRSTESIGFHACGSIVLTDASLERALEVICVVIATPLTTIPPGETLTIERQHAGCAGTRCAPAWEFDGIAGEYRVRVHYVIDRPKIVEGVLGAGAGVSHSDSFVVTFDSGAGAGDLP